MRKYINTKLAERKVTLLLKSRDIVNLNIGCGTDYKEGWINIDNNTDKNIVKLDLNWDLRHPLPFADGTVDYIYNEHFFEHLTPDEALPVLQDLHRVLKSGGVLRIAMPDLELLVDQYLHLPLDKDKTIKKFDMHFLRTRAERLNVSMRWWGHVWLYDWDELDRRLQDAGFTRNTRCKLNDSKHKPLRKLETREESALISESTK